MIRRILLDPAPVEGGNGNGGNPTPAPAPTPPAPALTPELLAELNDLRSFRAQADAATAQRAEAERLAEQQRLAAQGRIEDMARAHNEQLAAERNRAAQLDQRIRESERARTLTAALAGHTLSYAEASADLAALWSADFETVDGPGGTFQTRCKTTLRPAADVVAERLASARYARFVAPDSRGGGGASGGANPAPTPNPNGQPLTYEQQIMKGWKDAQAADTSRPSWQRDYRSNLTRRN